MPKKTAVSGPKPKAKPKAKTSISTGYWLVKSEPDVFSVDDFAKAKNKTTCWDGVRNYQARNFLRDLMKLGDQVLFYHSNATPTAIVGLAKVVKEGYADHTALDSKSDHYDPKSTRENPLWYMVDIQLIRKFSRALSLTLLKETKSLKGMMLLQRGSRLSVQPVLPEHFQEIIRLADSESS